MKAYQLGGVDLTGAIVPDSIRDSYEAGLVIVKEISKNARAIFLSLIAGSLYSLITLLTVATERTVKLPILLIDIPTTLFLGLTPVVLLATFSYLHLYLQKLWEAIAKLPAFFPDGRSLDEHIYPWLINEVVRYNVPLLRNQEGQVAFYRVRQFTPWVLGWWVVPFSLQFFALQAVSPYLANFPGALLAWEQWSIPAVMWVTSLIFAFIFSHKAIRTMEGAETSP